MRFTRTYYKIYSNEPTKGLIVERFNGNVVDVHALLVWPFKSNQPVHEVVESKPIHLNDDI